MKRCRLRFELLADHDRSGFRCGDDALDRWWSTQAGQDQRKDVARVFIAIDDEGIAGFYSISMFGIRVEELPPKLKKRLPHYPLMPAVLLGRLARHERLRGQGVGELLVADAIKRIVAAERQVAAVVIVVHAKNKEAARFYEGLGFQTLPNTPHHLFMTMADARAAVLQLAADLP